MSALVTSRWHCPHPGCDVEFKVTSDEATTRDIAGMLIAKHQETHPAAGTGGGDR